MGSLAGYSELRVLGAGAQGRVVLARHDESGAIVAIKYLHAAQTAALAAFRAEAALLRRVADPHVAAFYGFHEEADGAAFVMEAVDGTDLKAIIREHAPLVPEAALAVLKGSLLGLDAAHRIGVVHRDYKPANVIVQRNGVSKLVDFVIAVLAGTRGRAGSRPYMSPEQWDRDVATPATDVYAATCVFFECLTGRLPYREEPLDEAHRSAPVPVEEVPEPVRGLMARGMAKDPADRPATAAAFVAELEAAATSAYGPGWERHGIAALGGLSVGAAVAGALGAGTATTAGPSAVQSVIGGSSPAVTGRSMGVFGANSTALMVASIVAGVVITGGTGAVIVNVLDDGPSRPEAVAQSAPLPLAYATADAVMLQNPDGTTRKLGDVTGDAPVEDLEWSADGASLAWSTGSDQANNDTGVHLASVRDGETHSWVCGDCRGIGFRGDTLISAASTDDAHQLVTFPADGGPPRREPIPGLSAADESSRVVLTAVVGDDPVLTYTTGIDPPDTTTVFYRLSASGGLREITSVPPPGVVSDPVVAPGSRTMAFASTSLAPLDDTCQERTSVNVVDLDGGRATAPQAPSGFPQVSSFWYDADGVLHASFLPPSGFCADPNWDGEPVPVTAAVFRLTDGRWTRTTSTAFATSYAANGDSATLESPIRVDGLLAFRSGTLAVSRKDGPVRVNGVRLFAWPPA